MLSSNRNDHQTRLWPAVPPMDCPSHPYLVHLLVVRRSPSLTPHAAAFCLISCSFRMIRTDCPTDRSTCFLARRYPSIPSPPVVMRCQAHNLHEDLCIYDLVDDTVLQAETGRSAPFPLAAKPWEFRSSSAYLLPPASITQGGTSSAEPSLIAVQSS